MRRRSKRAPILSESTGKIGQELPSNQPAPLVPLYPDEGAAPAPQERATHLHEGGAPSGSRRSPEPRPVAPERQSRPDRFPRPRPAPDWNEPPSSGRLEVETQPEMPSVPPPEVQAADRS